MIRITSIAFPCAVLVTTATWLGCGGDEEPAGVPAVLSQQGETCERTADCAANLACFAGTCRPVDTTEVTPNPKECALVQCNNAPSDCCSAVWTRPSECRNFEDMCNADPTSYACTLLAGPLCTCTESSYLCEKNLCVPIECTTPTDCCTRWVPNSSCQMYDEQCKLDPVRYESYCEMAEGPECNCDPAAYTCTTSHRCQELQTCENDDDCRFGSAQQCVAGICVECEYDPDCPVDGAKCINNSCVQPQCETNLDCPAFYACETGPTGYPECIKKGCATNRECMVYESSYLAFCNTTATPLPECQLRCTRDAECAESTNPLRQCVNGLCIDPGCDTDEECKLRLETVVGGNGTKAVCRDKVAGQ